MIRILKFVTLYLTILTLLSGCGNRQISFVTIGTGGVTGVYYPTGGAISRLINTRHEQYHLKVTVESTGGSVYNINAVLKGDLDLGIAQSDRQYQAYHGSAEWQSVGPCTRLRSVFSIYPEVVTLIASENSGIISVMDLPGKRINLGNPGSGQLQNSLDVLNALGFSSNDIKAEYVKAIEAPGLLQDGRIDAFFYTVGHPSGTINEASAGRQKVRFISLEHPGLLNLIREQPYYTRAFIPGDFYPSALSSEDIQSIGVRATLVTSCDVPEEVIYAITKEVFENLEDFRELHPAFQTLTRESMLTGLTAPFHSGSLKYFNEINLLDQIPVELITD